MSRLLETSLSLEQEQCGTVSWKEYVCSGNFAWVDWKYTNSPGVPVLQSAVHDYAERQYSGDPNKFRKPNVVIGVDSADEPPSLLFLPMTPQEEIIAPYVALAKSMAGVSLADSDVDGWLEFFRTTLFTFKVLHSQEEKEFETITIRQHANAIIPIDQLYTCAMGIQTHADEEGS